MSMGRTSLSFVLALSLTACGGGGGGSTGPISGGGGGTPTPTASACTLSARQDFAKGVLDEWFLYPELIDSTVNKANYSTVQAYIDAVLKPFFTQKKNAQFTYITSIKEEDAFYNSGSSAGFGFRLGYDTTQNRVFVLETFEGTAALSGFAQATGYLVAALGPFGMAVLHDATGGWTVPLLCLVALVVPLAAAGTAVSRPAYVVDELGLPR